MRTFSTEWRGERAPDFLIHKKKQASLIHEGGGARSVCGRIGYVTTLWRNVTCDACLPSRPPYRRRKTKKWW